MRRPIMSQLKVSLTRDAYELLDELAVEQGTTRGNLVRQWVHEKIDEELDHRSRVRQRVAALKRQGM